MMAHTQTRQSVWMVVVLHALHAGAATAGRDMESGRRGRGVVGAMTLGRFRHDQVAVRGTAGTETD